MTGNETMLAAQSGTHFQICEVLIVQRTWELEGLYCGRLEVLKAKRRISQP